MPAFPLHGWMPDAYRVAPLPALALFSGVLSKVGAYGFLRVVLPIFPAATNHFQEVILVIAVVSILYGSVMAFTQTSARLIAGYSSVAQLGFITLGIFSLRADGADGAVLQMVNHGLVIGPLLLICAVLVARAGTRRHHQDGRPRDEGAGAGGDLPDRHHGPARHARAPPTSSASSTSSTGSSRRRSSTRFIAAIGIAMAAYYALRLYQHAMHNRKPEGIESREVGLREGAVIGALVACIVALALWPGLILGKADDSVNGTLTATGQQTPEQVAQR